MAFGYQVHLEIVKHINTGARNVTIYQEYGMYITSS